MQSRLGGFWCEIFSKFSWNVQKVGIKIIQIQSNVVFDNINSCHTYKNKLYICLPKFASLLAYEKALI